MILQVQCANLSSLIVYAKAARTDARLFRAFFYGPMSSIGYGDGWGDDNVHVISNHRCRLSCRRSLGWVRGLVG